MRLYLVLALVATQSLHADWVIVQKSVADDKHLTITTKMKDNMIRSDVGDQMTAMINRSDGMMQIYMHSRKTSMRVDSAAIKGASALAGKFLGGGDDSQPAKPKATGEKVKVGDWDTEVYTWQGKIGSGKFYVAKDFPKFAELNAVMDKTSKSISNPVGGMFPSFAEFPGMVVKSETTIMGRTKVTELVSAKEEPVSADDFKPLEGYTEMTMPSFPGGTRPPKP